eukprot:TRINITY_DN1446_c0_g1_i1.p1 TRINITY_DN1446_c0_g1~~TRINITY_DN1446_c0_g1_i1.p1  ORF type:complete len:234 (+),score=120.15 TRINITY_DN1446_c0_g1_i1:74-775(+)
MAMSDSQVKQQLQQMVNFIQQEAREKAEEIRVQAEEEFNIERQSIVREEKKKISKEHERKMKQVEVRKKIARSNELNQARIRVLKAQEEAIQQIYNMASQKLADVASSGGYEQMLSALLVQGLIKLGEDEVELICRQCDEGVLQKSLAAAQSDYKQKTGKDVQLTINQVHRLAPPPSGQPGPSCCGGVLLSARGGRILCNNTLEQRLALAYEAFLPDIRMALFGKSQSRKFTS